MLVVTTKPEVPVTLRMSSENLRILLARAEETGQPVCVTVKAKKAKVSSRLKMIIDAPREIEVLREELVQRDAARQAGEGRQVK